MVTIWDWAERTVVARCVGHESWVTQIALDPFISCEGGYRFLSVGLDTQMILWDFSFDALIPPKRKVNFIHVEWS